MDPVREARDWRGRQAARALAREARAGAAGASAVFDDGAEVPGSGQPLTRMEVLETLPEPTGDDIGRIVHVRSDAAVDTLNIGVSQADGTVTWVPLNIQLDTGSVTYVYSAQFGSAGTAAGQFASPWDAVTDGSGNVYVTDLTNNRVQKFGPSGTYTARLPTSGTSAGSGNAQFNQPRGIAINAAGTKVYVCDTENHRVQVLTTALAADSRFGSNGTGNGQFRFPRGIAIDSSDNVWVADTGNERLQRLSATGTWAATVSMPGNEPAAVAVDASNVYVAESRNHRVYVFDKTTGASVRYWGGYGNANGRFTYPSGIDVTSDGYVFVADSYNHRVQVFTTDGTFVARFGEFGSGSGQVWNPKGVHVSSATNRIWVADTNNNRLQAFVRQGLTNRVTGTGVTVANGTSATATVDCPVGMVPTGGGFDWNGEASANLVVNDSVPTATGWSATGRNAKGSGGATLRAWVVCLSG